MQAGYYWIIWCQGGVPEIAYRSSDGYWSFIEYDISSSQQPYKILSENPIPVPS